MRLQQEILTSKVLQCCMDAIGRFVKQAISQADGDEKEWDKGVLHQLRLVRMFTHPPVGALQAWEPPTLREAITLKDSHDELPSLFSKFPAHGQGMVQVLETRLKLIDSVEALLGRPVGPGGRRGHPRLQAMARRMLQALSSSMWTRICSWRWRSWRPCGPGWRRWRRGGRCCSSSF